jgi:hypothetical protein
MSIYRIERETEVYTCFCDAQVCIEHEVGGVHEYDNGCGEDIYTTIPWRFTEQDITYEWQHYTSGNSFGAEIGIRLPKPVYDESLGRTVHGFTVFLQYIIVEEY